MKLAVLVVAGLTALGGFADAAQALPALVPAGVASPVIKTGIFCPPGFKLAGGHCLPTKVRPSTGGLCPIGYRLGPEGHYCWLY